MLHANKNLPGELDIIVVNCDEVWRGMVWYGQLYSRSILIPGTEAFLVKILEKLSVVRFFSAVRRGRIFFAVESGDVLAISFYRRNFFNVPCWALSGWAKGFSTF